MVFSKSLRAGALLCLSGAMPGAPAFAQEAAPGGQATQTSDSRLSELFYQLQVLQREVQELRGLVEEQSHQINRLTRDQKEQYIDLDRRVAELTTGGAVGAGALSRPPTAQPGSGAGTGIGPSITTRPAPGSAGGPPAAAPAMPASGDEREVYQNAFDLMKSRQFDQSIAAFNRLIADYPSGQYTPNAFYWLGELYLAQQNLEQARQSFMQVISLYPDHPKVPDTLYKLGVAYHRLGDDDRAMQYFNQVRSQYPQSSAAGLAASYQQELR